RRGGSRSRTRMCPGRAAGAPPSRWKKAKKRLRAPPAAAPAARTRVSGAVSDNGVTDITILGAGPTGLPAAYYAGHRDASVRIIESLEQLGGQVAAVYPEKHVYDVAGHPKIQGTKLIDLCAEQG